MREAAAIAKPFQFMVEDDFTLTNHPGIAGFGCCCDLHLRAFAERAGRYYSREELREVFAHTDDEEDAVKAIKGDLCLMERTDAELERLLSGAVLLDGEAAVYLTKRGFSDLTGVEATEADRVAFTQDHPGDLLRIARR